MLFNECNEIATDPKLTAYLLQKQFHSFCNVPKCSDFPKFVAPEITYSLADENYNILVGDIITAIDEISSDSACGSDGVPVCLVKHFSKELVPIHQHYLDRIIQSWICFRILQGDSNTSPF